MTEQPNEAAQSEDFEFEALKLADNYRQALITEFAAELRGRVLEVGSGIGQMTSLIRSLSSVELLQCVEPCDAFCEVFSREHPTIPLVHGTATDIDDTAGWNAIVSINVLEHIRDDAGELKRYRELLASEQGTLCLFVPARLEIYAPIDEDFGHYRRYTRPGLLKLLESAGFAVRRLHYFNCVGYFAWWLSFCVFRQRGFNPDAVRFFDRVILPAVHAAERGLCRPPFGQSLLAVATAS